MTKEDIDRWAKESANAIHAMNGRGTPHAQAFDNVVETDIAKHRIKGEDEFTFRDAVMQACRELPTKGLVVKKTPSGKTMAIGVISRRSLKHWMDDRENY